MVITEQKQACKKCASGSVVLVEYAFERHAHYEGATEVLCLSCGARFGRWSGNEIVEEAEKKAYSSKEELEAITYWLHKAQTMLSEYQQGELSFR